MFDSPVRNPFGLKSANGLAFPGFADLDGDGDQDLLVGEDYGVKKYFQNTGTPLNPQFEAPQVNPFGLISTSRPAFPAFADLDGDGDIDLLVGELYGALIYFQNIGTPLNPDFAAPLTNPFGLDSTYIFALTAFADLDDDGDQDLLIGEYYGVLKYYQNTGTSLNPQFAKPQENPFGLASTYNVAAPAFADLDRDGDLDLLVGEYFGTMQYFQNTGSALNPQFAPPVANPFGIVQTYYYAFPAFADLDGDGNSELLVGEYEGVMQFFQNLGVGIADVSQSFDLKLSPNPVNNILNIESEETISKIEIFNTLGENVMTVEHQVGQVSLHHLIPGIYLMKVSYDLGQFTTAKILKQ